MEYGPDSTRHSDVPRGVVTQHEWKSQIYAGTRRNYWVYVPAQYDGQTPAGLMVFQDGHNFRGYDYKFVRRRRRGHPAGVARMAVVCHASGRLMPSFART